MYKNENIQKLLKWARIKVKDTYYRDIAVYVQMSETFERSIVFTHAEISINEESYTKSDFVTITVTVNQKRDKFAGVMFGDDIDSTYKKAWKKVLNPPRLNIYVPVTRIDNKEFAPTSKGLDEIIKQLPKWANGNTLSSFDDLTEFDMKGTGYYDYGKIINADNRVKFSKAKNSPYFLYSDGPEEISKVETQSLITYYPMANEGQMKYKQSNGREIPVEHVIPNNKDIDIEFYHKNNTKNYLIVGILVKNEGPFPALLTKREADNEILKSKYFLRNGMVKMKSKEKLHDDEKEKENMCAELELGFLKDFVTTNISLESGDVKFISWIALEGQLNNKDPLIRMYGRVRINCISGNVKIRVVSTLYDKCLVEDEFIDKEKLKNIWKSAYLLEKSASGQFSGLIDYTEMNLSVKNMNKNECVMLGAYERPNNTITNNNYKVAYPKSYGEYPETSYYKHDGKNYFFGSFGIIYNITFEWNNGYKTNGNRIVIYPFGHSLGFFANVLINDGSGWRKTGSIERDKTANGYNQSIYEQLKKDDGESTTKDKTTSVRYLNYYTGDKIKETQNNIINIPNGISKFGIRFMISGGNCAGIKLKFE